MDENGKTDGTTAMERLACEMAECVAMFLPNIEKPDIKKTQAMVGPQNMTRLSFKIAVEMAMMSPALKKVAPKPPTAL